LEIHFSIKASKIDLNRSDLAVGIKRCKYAALRKIHNGCRTFAIGRWPILATIGRQWGRGRIAVAVADRGDGRFIGSMALCGCSEGAMRKKLWQWGWSAGLLHLFACAVLAAPFFAFETSAANAQSGGGGYFIEFRSRYAWDYGHTYLVFGRVGERIGKANVAGLSPVGDDATAWVIGHYVPVPAETGWTDGDLEDKYVSARYRVTMNKDQFDRAMTYIKHLQATSHTWSAELYNCNAFVGDVAKFIGLQVPSSSLIYPKVYVNNLRKINTGHPEAADQLVSDNMKEMQSPTRDGRAMISSGVHTVTVREDRERQGTPVSTPTPRVIIGPVRVSSSAGTSGGAAEPSP
jgi:hypothetical protein